MQNVNCMYHLIFIYECVCHMLSRVLLFVTPWTIVQQAPLSMEFFRHGIQANGLPFSSPGDLPKPICVSCVSMIARRSFNSELSLDKNENIIKQNELKRLTVIEVSPHLKQKFLCVTNMPYILKRKYQNLGKGLQ